MGLYVQYGCGLSCPDGWVNFDASPTLRLQKIPVIGRLFKGKVRFPAKVRYGNIVRGLPGIQDHSCDGVYCSHVLEHLSLEDSRIAIRNTHAMLKAGGAFRCVLPDLESSVRDYQQLRDRSDPSASLVFMRSTMLGMEVRSKGIKDLIASAYGNSKHLWMWDAYSLKEELKNAGFSTVRTCKFNDSDDLNFCQVESEDRFYKAVALEAIR